MQTAGRTLPENLIVGICQDLPTIPRFPVRQTFLQQSDREPEAEICSGSEGKNFPCHPAMTVDRKRKNPREPFHENMDRTRGSEGFFNRLDSVGALRPADQLESVALELQVAEVDSAESV
jgi:hypothetical protein